MAMEWYEISVNRFFQLYHAWINGQKGIKVEVLPENCISS